MLGREDPNFSFSGLKTAVRQQAQALAPVSDQDIADICASFELAAIESVVDRVARAMTLFESSCTDSDKRPLVIAGGVAANTRLKAELEGLSGQNSFTLYVPPAELCTDNAAMVACAGYYRFEAGQLDGLDLDTVASAPLV